MTTEEIAEIVDSDEYKSGELRRDLVPRDAPAPTLFNTDDPQLIIAKASGVAKVLKDVIVKQHMSLKIGSSQYVKVEGWTTLGSLLGVFPKVEWTRELTTGEPIAAVRESLGWEAAVEVVNNQGVVIGRAEAQCLRAERNWKGRDDFALRSMAQTRAMGKALRMPLGWIAVLAGYEATPAEEMPSPAVDDSDVPFDDKTGGAQGQQVAEPASEAHGAADTGAASTPPPAMTREEALEVRRFALSKTLGDLAAKLGKRTVTEAAIGKNRLKNEDKPAAHLVWLEQQIEAAQAKVAEQEEQLPI